MTKYTNHTQNTTVCLTSFVKKKKKKSHKPDLLALTFDFFLLEEKYV